MRDVRERCIANLYLLAKKKGIKIGELETACGVSIGYLARLRQDKRKPLPGTEFLLRAVDRLGTTMDALMHFDYAAASDTDLYLHRFLGRLIADTLTEKLIWDPDTGCYPDPVVLDGVVHPDHPLLALDMEMMLKGKSKQIYLSAYHPGAANLMPREAWRTRLSEETFLLLIRVSPEREQPVPKPDPEESIELYLYHAKEKALSTVGHTDREHPALLDDDLRSLLESVSELQHLHPLDELTTSAIDAYMSAPDPLRGVRGGSA